MNEAEAELAKSLAGALGQCLEIGFQTPLHVAAIGIKGGGVVFRYDEAELGLKPTYLAEFIGPEGLTLPINLMITDTRGEAARVVIRNDGEPQFFH